jgi:apolipoprotein D and lipocalin family protein
MEPLKTARWYRRAARSISSLIALICCLGGCADRAVAPLPTVAAVDLPRYMGTWFEIARLPNRFQAVCTGDTQAQYRLDGDVVRVINRCRKEDGTVTQAQGRALPVAGSGNTKLRVSFFRPFYGDYWILALDPDYRWVLVGEPKRRYAWILSRTPLLEEATIAALLDQAAGFGFDRMAFQRTPQTLTAD